MDVREVLVVVEVVISVGVELQEVQVVVEEESVEMQVVYAQFQARVGRVEEGIWSRFWC